jgi:GNAT superfamily N-acetyltransferase
VVAARYRIEPLDTIHGRANFASGSADLDRYFRQQAGQDQRRHVAAVFVAVDMQLAEVVAGFYTLSATSVEVTALPPKVAARLPRYPLLPAILLGRLARDERWRGQGLGELLLTDALRRSLRLSTQLGLAFVVVDAKDDAVGSFYERYGFSSFPDQSRRLFIPLDRIATLGL